MKTKKQKILIVDDEADIREILRFNLENEDYIIDEASSSEEAETILSDEHSLILLDIMMGGRSGFQFADSLRKKGNNIPIIFLTAKGAENDMLTGFSLGADDYISKPFSIKEVMARIKSVLRRSAMFNNENDNISSDLLEAEGIKLYTNTKEVFIDESPISLTKTEFCILHLLMSNVGKLYSREEILNKVWPKNGVVLERTVDVHIARLRKKIGKYSYLIINRTGYGYTFSIN